MEFAAFIALGALVAGFLAGFGAGRLGVDGGQEASEHFLDLSLGKDNSEELRRAVALVVGRTREHDSLTYGEWYRARYERACSLPPGAFEFMVQVQGAFGNGAYRIDVGPTVADGIDLPADCTTDHLNPPMLAAVWSDSGAIVPLGYERGSLSVVVGGDERLERDQPEMTGPFDEFLSGAAP